MDMTHGNPWGVPWDPRVGTMGAPWVGSLSLLGLKGPLGLLDPWASLDPRASWHPREPRGQGSSKRYKAPTKLNGYAALKKIKDLRPCHLKVLCCFSAGTFNGLALNRSNGPPPID